MSSSCPHTPNPDYGSMQQSVEVGHRWLDDYTNWQAADIRILKQLPSVYQIRKRQQHINNIANHQIQRGFFSDLDISLDDCWSQKFMPREFA